jgi:hypothetical protein
MPRELYTSGGHHMLVGIDGEMVYEWDDPSPQGCRMDDDAECRYPACPQVRDGEPYKTGRDCPLSGKMSKEGQ